MPFLLKGRKEKSNNSVIQLRMISSFLESNRPKNERIKSAKQAYPLNKFMSLLTQDKIVKATSSSSFVGLL